MSLLSPDDHVAISSVLSFLASKRQIDRERGLSSLTLVLAMQELRDERWHALASQAMDMIQAASGPALSAVEGDASDGLSSALSPSPLTDGSSWENRYAPLMVLKAVVESRSKNECREEGLEWSLQRQCMHWLEDEEVRVRVEVGDCLQSLAGLQGLPLLESCMERVLLSIHENYDREGEGSRREKEGEGGSQGPASPTASRPNSRNSSFGDLIGMLLQSSYRVTKPGTGELRHGTEGWKCLETSCRALGQMLEGCGEACEPMLTDDFLELISRSQMHPNRFVREVSHFTVSTICRVKKGEELARVGRFFEQQLAGGLTDNWSQVRYAASVATRSLMTHLPLDARDPFLPTLLPPMCLNRYYEAEGVRLYSQQTWKDVMGEAGRDKVAQNIDKVVAYYVAQTKSSNHGVRESACACIAELMEKIDRQSVAPHVKTLLHSLSLCFKDMGWPVRDAACTAFGRCVLSHPAETKPLLELELWDLWFAHLWDNIPSVRRNSAIAVANAVRSYGGEVVLSRVAPVIKDLLSKALEQPNDQKGSVEGGRLSAKGADNDPKLHSDQEMFSCSTLTGRMGKDYYIRSDGCMDYGFNREREPWEASDGALHLLEQLARVSTIVPEAATLVKVMLERLPDLAALRSFKKASNLRETLWMCLQGIAEGLGKQKFKAHLDGLIDPMISDMTCGHQLTEVAAEKCLFFMRRMLGPNLFDARLNQQQIDLVHSLGLKI